MDAIAKLLGLPIDASTHGQAIDNIIVYLHILMFVLFIGWGAFFAFVLYRFRRGGNPKADYVGAKSHASSYLEGIIVIIEIVLLIGFSIPFWAKKVSAASATPASNAVHVRIVAQQFAWNIHYPGKDGKFGRTSIEFYNERTNPLGVDPNDRDGKDDVTTINRLVIPVGTPILVELNSRDVIHSFAVPLLRVKQDAVPGISIPVSFEVKEEMTSDKVAELLARKISLTSNINCYLFKATEDYKDKSGNVIVKKGSRLPKELDERMKLVEQGLKEISVVPAEPVEIVCGQLCGNGHFSMKGYVNLLTPKDFEKWLKDNAPETDDEEPKK